LFNDRVKLAAYLWLDHHPRGKRETGTQGVAQKQDRTARTERPANEQQILGETGHTRRARVRLQLACDEVGGLVGHARLDVGTGEMLRPVVLPGVRVGRVADRVVAVAQLDGPVVVNRAEVRDRTHPPASVAEQGDGRDVLIDAGGRGLSKPNALIGAASTTSVTAAPSE